MNFPAWVSVEKTTVRPAWVLTDFEYTPPGQTDDINIYVRAWHASGKPAIGATAIQIFPTGQFPQTLKAIHVGQELQAGTDWPMSGDSSFDPARGERGPYSVRMDGPSDTVTGMGLPLKHHVKYLLVFTYSLPLPPPPVPKTLEETMYQNARLYKWMPINNQAALWRYAKDRGLEDAQTDEFRFVFQGKDYVGQVFNLGIAFAEVANLGNIRHLPKLPEDENRVFHAPEIAQLAWWKRLLGWFKR